MCRSVTAVTPSRRLAPELNGCGRQRRTPIRSRPRSTRFRMLCPRPRESCGPRFALPSMRPATGRTEMATTTSPPPRASLRRSNVSPLLSPVAPTRWIGQLRSPRRPSSRCAGRLSPMALGLLLWMTVVPPKNWRRGAPARLTVICGRTASDPPTPRRPSPERGGRFLHTACCGQQDASLTAGPRRWSSLKIVSGGAQPTCARFACLRGFG